MDQALNRTRRNMIGVGMILTLVYAFGWQFPSEIRIFGNIISANAHAVQLIAWGALAYFVWEYLVHVSIKSLELRTEWRTRFVQAHHRRIKRRMIKKYDDDALQRVLDEWKQKGYDSVAGVHAVELNIGSTHFLRQEIVIKTLINLVRDDSSDTYVPISEVPQYKAYYVLSLWPVLRAWVLCVLTSRIYFEFFLPVLFPLAAVLSFIFGPFPVLIDEPKEALGDHFLLWMFQHNGHF